MSASEEPFSKATRLNVCFPPIADSHSTVQAASVNGRLARIALLSGAATLLVGGGYLALAGSAVVIDETGGVSSAVVTNGRSEQPLRRLWGGYFYAIPKIEGTIEVRCHNGAKRQWGYVTGHMHTKIKVAGKTPCSDVVEVIWGSSLSVWSPPIADVRRIADST